MEARSQRTPGYATLATGGYYWSLFALGLVVASIGPSLPTLASHTGVTIGRIGLLFTAYRLGYLVGSLIGGQLLDRVAGHLTVALALLLMAAAIASVPWIYTLAVLLGIVLLLGTAAGTAEVGGNTLLLWLHGERSGPFMNGLHFAFGLGAILSPVVIGRSIAATSDIVIADSILGFLMLPGVILLLWLRSPERSAERDSETALQVRSGLVVLVSLALLLYVGAESGFGGWIYTYAERTGLASTAVAATLSSLFWAALTAGRLATVPLAAKLRPSALLLASVVGCVISAAVLMVWPGSVAALWVGTLGMGMSMAAVFPSTISLAGRYLPVRGAVSRWYFVGAGLGGMSVPWVLGQAVETQGMRALLPLLLVVLVMLVVVVSVLVWSAPRAGEAHADEKQ